MKPDPLLREKLEQAAAGKAKRPRGNSVTAAEYTAVAAFAKALDELVETSLHADMYAPDEGPADFERVTAPSEALPPLP